MAEATVQSTGSMDRSSLRWMVTAGALAGVGAGFAGGFTLANERPVVEPVVVAAVAEPEAVVDEGLEGIVPTEDTNDVISDEVALEQARALGLLDAVREVRPTLRTGIVERLGMAFVREGHRNGIDPLLLAAVAKVESHYNPFATSSVGARGVLQVKPKTGRWMLSRDNEDLIADGELYDLETNVELGARYLASLMDRFDSLEVVLVAYNRGARGARMALAGPKRKEVLNGYPRKVLRAKAGLVRRGVLANLETAPEAPQL